MGKKYLPGIEDPPIIVRVQHPEGDVSDAPDSTFRSWCCSSRTQTRRSTCRVVAFLILSSLTSGWPMSQKLSCGPFLFRSRWKVAVIWALR